MDENLFSGGGIVEGNVVGGELRCEYGLTDADLNGVRGNAIHG